MQKDKNKKIKQINETCEIDRLKIFVEEEDKEIEKVALKKSTNYNKWVILYVIIFLIVCVCSFIQINSYIEKKNLFMNNSETRINSKDSTLIINNNSKVSKYNENSIINTLNTEATVTNESYLDLNVNKDSKSKIMYNYNVRYRIYNNDFVSSDDETAPRVYVRFAYSTDKETWTYINNVISTTSGTLMPTMGNKYDVTGLKSTLSVATNYEITGKPGKNNRLYWRCETTYSGINNELINEMNYEADFNVEYSY